MPAHAKPASGLLKNIIFALSVQSAVFDGLFRQAGKPPH
jgi:hypothetical protein